MEIMYVNGDATQPNIVPGASNFLIHCCNDIGKWNKGFVNHVSKRWPITRQRFISNYINQIDHMLGDIQVIPVSKDLTVINMIGQHGIYTQNGVPPFRYPALKQCLDKVRDITDNAPTQSVIHCPRFSAGLNKGDWQRVEGLLEATFFTRTVNIIVYDLDDVD